MKKVIKRPHYEMRCPKCGCHFSFEVQDIGNDGDLLCPCCDKWIRVQDSETKYLLPKVKVRLENESNNDEH